MTGREKWGAMGWPVWPDVAAAMNVDMVDVKQHRHPHYLVGNGWHFACAGVLKVAVLAGVAMLPLVMAPGMFTEVIDDVLYMLVRVPRDGRCLAYVLLLGRTFTAEQQTAWKAQARNESGVPACLTRYEWEREQAFALADELDLLSVGSKHTELVKAAAVCFRKGLCPEHHHVLPVMEVLDVRLDVRYGNGIVEVRVNSSTHACVYMYIYIYIYARVYTSISLKGRQQHMRHLIRQRPAAVVVAIAERTSI